MVTAPMMLGLLVVADDFVHVVLGETWAPMTGVLRVFCVIGLLQSIASPVGTVYLSRGRTKTLFWMTSILTPFIVTAFVIGLPWGIWGVAVAYAVAVLSIFYVTLVVAFRIGEIPLRSFHAAVARPLLAAAAMSLVVLGSRWLMPDLLSTPWRFVTSVALGAVVYPVLLVAWNRRQSEDFVARIREALATQGSRRTADSPVEWRMKTILKRTLGRVFVRAHGWAIYDPPDLTRISAWQGLEGVLHLLEESQGMEAVRLLRNGGAQVGDDVRILRGLVVHNADPDFSKLTIGDSCHIGRQVFLDVAAPIRLGNRVTISMRCIVLTHFDPGSSTSEGAQQRRSRCPVVIEDDVYVGASVVVLPGVRLGKGCIVGAGAVVTRDIPPGEVAVGSPARTIASRQGA
jgi:acetyltransferase-like isoleucine patch superfamily enzyme